MTVLSKVYLDATLGFAKGVDATNLKLLLTDTKNEESRILASLDKRHYHAISSIAASVLQKAEIC